MVVTAVVAVTTCDNDDAHLTYEFPVSSQYVYSNVYAYASPQDTNGIVSVVKPHFTTLTIHSILEV